jgi:ATP-dependent Lon protease
MFPLGTVLFPGAALPLHVFEPRYRTMTGHCLEGDGRMGVVLIERGSEVGGGDVRFGVGTMARIADSAALPDGRWVLVLVGEVRVRVERWLPEEPYPRAEVVVVPDGEPGPEAAEARHGVESRLARAHGLMASLGEWPADKVGVALPADPAAAGWAAAALAPLGPADAQRVLEADGLDDRLRLLTLLLDEQIALLALRARGG